MQIEKNILAPFWLFFIIIGVLGVIVLPTVNALISIEESLYTKIFNYTWAIAALVSLFYTAISLKTVLFEKRFGKGIYILLIIIFLLVLMVPFIRVLEV